MIKHLKEQNVGVFAEGRYIKFWGNPAYDFKLGLNYQFKW